MKMNIRPVTVLLLIILLVVGANVVLYHMGMFDSFFSKIDNDSSIQAGEGPVVRKAVTNMVLPIESSPVEIPPAEGMNETDLSSENSSVSVADTKVAAGSFVAENKTAPVAQNVPVVPEKVVEEKKSTPKSDSTKIGGVVGRIVTTCNADKVVVNIPLSSPAGRVTWFNLQNPRKLVIDIRGSWDNKGKSLYRLKGCPVEKIVTGEHPDKMRLVFYISKKDVPKRVTPSIKKDLQGLILGLNF